MRGALFVNDPVYAELSVYYPSVDAVEEMLTAAQVDVLPIPRSALFLAGKAFQRYRASGGTRTGVLPDFFIGAHAAVMGVKLLTRDPRRYRQYFPTVELICPGG